MTTRSVAILAVAAVCLASLALAQPAEPLDPLLANWTAPPYWTPPVGHQALRTPGAASAQNIAVKTETISPSPIYPFTALAPCRVIDTFHNAGLDAETYSSVSDSTGGDFAAGEIRM